MKNQPTNPKLNRTSLTTVNPPGSRTGLNDSRLSLKSTSAGNSTRQTSASVNARSCVFMPPNPYSVPSRPLPASCQDSELQSVVSVEIGGEQSTRTAQTMSASRHARSQPPFIQSLDFSQLSISTNAPAAVSTVTSTAGVASEPTGHDRRQHAAANVDLAKNPDRFVDELIRRLERELVRAGQPVTYAHFERPEQRPPLPPGHLQHDSEHGDIIHSPQNHVPLDPGPATYQMDTSTFATNSHQQYQHHQQQSQQHVLLGPPFQHYQPTFKTKEVCTNRNNWKIKGKDTLL